MNGIRQILFGLRFRLLLLVLLASAPLFALTLHTALEDRRRQVEIWQQRSFRLAQVARNAEDRLITDTQQLLLAFSESSAVRSAQWRNARNLLEDLLASYPKYASLGVISPNGQLLATFGKPFHSANLTNESFFRRAMEFGSFAVGDLSAVQRRHRPTVSFAQPVFDRNGEIKALVFATAELRWLDTPGSDSPAQSPRGATWTLVDTNGIILARYPRPLDWLGRPFPDPSLVRSAFDSPNEPLVAPGPGGKESVYAFAPLPSRFVDGEALTILSMPRQALFAASDRAAIRNLTWLGLAGGLALFLGWIGSSFLVVRPVKALVRSSSQLARGDLKTRTGLRHGRDELGQLTLSFDLMAQALEQRERDRQRANHKLQVLSHRLVEVQESERRHIARELHDEIGQTLTAAELNLRAAQQTSERASRDRRLAEGLQAVERVLDQVHDLSLNLRPSMLDDLGLESALRWYTHRQADLARLKVEFRPVPLTHRLHPVIETECFRIAQEALTNVVRHAKARSVVVELTQIDGTLHLSVRDDGIGFDVTHIRDEAVGGASLGVLSMEERATLTGGGLQIISEPGKGTEVKAWFPLTYHQTQALLFEATDR